jgi:hypothetical protein
VSGKRSLWCCAAGWLTLLFVTGGPLGAAEDPPPPAAEEAALPPAAAEASLPPLNKLSGIVVSKKDGQPLADVQVAITHAEQGNLVFIGGGRLRAFGRDESVLWFFPKRNGRVKVQGRTDAEGRFTLEGFTSPESKYNVGATHPEYGSALLTDIIPAAYGERELRIELDEPSFIRTEIAPFDEAFSAMGWEFLALELAAEPPAPASAPADSAPATEAAAERDRPEAPRVTFDLEREPGGSEREGGMARWGPLPAGRKYVVSRVRYAPELFYTATLLARTVKLAEGETLKVDLKPGGDISLTGQVTGLDDQPLAGVNVKLRVGDDLVIGAISGANGEYTLQNVPAGKHVFDLYRRAAPGFG